ncbi:EI24 domain-containing protein [Cnuibacter sp. UC19_7]|uniref:EI24 domain-containing protein n=1 Tax=Cnuibacter sp. UC19_7 TaxID=3350166 RepID=UPI0036719C48
MRVLREFFGGVGVLGRGLALWASAPRLMLLGAIPALIVGLVYLAGIIALIIALPTLTETITPFADDWDAGWRTALRLAAGAALVGLAVLVVVFTYTAITLVVGDPFYERIRFHVEERESGAPPEEAAGGFWGQMRRGLVTTLRMLLLTAAVGLLLFAGGLIPVIGQTVVPVFAALFGGWVLAIELTGYAFDARALTLRDRRRMLGVRRARTLGFGVTVYLLFLLPLGAVFVMPAAAAGATLLAREALLPRAPRPDGTTPVGPPTPPRRAS